MKIAEERKKTETILDIYRKKLDSITDEQFTETPRGGGWSYAEVYSHIMQATIMSAVSVEKCTAGNCKPTSKKLNLLGKLIFLFGRMPPLRVKQPKVIAEKMPAAKITKEEARNMIVKCRQRLDAVAQMSQRADKEGRTAHPRLGMLNAGQWLKFIRMHLVHHLSQLKRIENKFSA